LTVSLAIVGAGIEILLSQVFAGDAGREEERGFSSVGVDPGVGAHGWVNVTARLISDRHDGLRLLVPYYQPTAFLATASSETELVVAIDQTLLHFSEGASRISVSEASLPSPIWALAPTSHGLVAVHEAGADVVTRDGLITLYTREVASWRVAHGSLVLE
jgi:hypothetical protein